MSSGHIVSTATGTTALTGSAWSSMITLYTNAAFPDAAQPPSAAFWAVLRLQFTVAADGGTIRAQLWEDADGLHPFMGPSPTAEIQNLGAAIGMGGMVIPYVTRPSATGLRKLYLKLYPSAGMTLAIGGATASWYEWDRR